ncbi:hypothetical protein LW734_001653 [Salmonella enterica]|nr:hypothetical protein [Salmonella enterica]
MNKNRNGSGATNPSPLKGERGLVLRHYASRRVALVALKKPFKISGATFFVALLRLLVKIFVALNSYAIYMHNF